VTQCKKFESTMEYDKLSGSFNTADEYVSTAIPWGGIRCLVLVIVKRSKRLC
jgi:hypothetical protein